MPSPTRHPLLAIWVHPNDESCGPGGALTRYAGEEVLLVAPCP